MILSEPTQVAGHAFAQIEAEPETDDLPRDPLARWAAQEMADRARRPRADTRDAMTKLFGCHTWQQGVTMLDVRLRYSATFWRVYPEKRLAIDRLDAGVTKESVAWRGEITRSNGYRWVPMERGKGTRDELLRAAGIPDTKHEQEAA